MPHKKNTTSEEHVLLGGREIRYTLKVHPCSRSIRVAAYTGGGFVVTIPRGVSKAAVGRFLIAQKEWILARIGLVTAARPYVPTEGAYAEKKDDALTVLEACVDAFNRHYRLDLRGVFVRNQKTRWGSCSQRKNLSFSYQVAHLPARLRDYVVVHELCHLIEFNHSRAFWSLVAETIPDHKLRKKELGRYVPR